MTADEWLLGAVHRQIAASLQDRAQVAVYAYDAGVTSGPRH